jgi:hypothetical protein
MFTPEEKLQFLNRLPPLELSYEPKLHKKVYSPLYYIVPKGPKALVWYTYWKEQHVCLLIRLNERGNYSDVQLYNTVFSDELALGTIIYGTTFFHQAQQTQTHMQSNTTQSNTYFTCEQLYYYKGLNVMKKNYQERLQLLLDMFTLHVEQVAYTKHSLIAGLPIICETYEEALAQLEQPYKTYGIAAMGQNTKSNAPYVKQHVVPTTFVPTSFVPTTFVPTTFVPTTFVPAPNAYAPTPNAYAPTPNAPTPNAPAPNAHAPAPASYGSTAYGKAVFKVKAGLAADNYQLYTLEDTFYDTALVSTYKCSVFLNTLFRTIKENANLDLLEESDDEEEFENTQLDKFVDLAKTVIMECVYSKRFKKWQPVKITQARITSVKELRR